MKTLWQILFQKLTTALRNRLDLAFTIMALRHQLAVLERSGSRPHLSPADRCFWVLLSTVWSRWTTALAIVQADTVRRWTRQGLRRHLAWQSRRKRPGRPVIAADTRTLIQRISRENGLWGAPRIHSELAKLGVRVSRTTVAKYMAHRSGPPALTWRTFLSNHARALIVSGADAELSQALRALYAQVIRILRRWLTWCATSRLQRSSQRSAVTDRAPRAPASVPAIRPLIATKSTGVYERGPPDFQSFPHDDPLRADPPRAGDGQRGSRLIGCGTLGSASTHTPPGKVPHPSARERHLTACHRMIRWVDEFLVRTGPHNGRRAPEAHPPGRYAGRRAMDRGGRIYRPQDNLPGWGAAVGKGRIRNCHPPSWFRGQCVGG
jgi:hypothetical protein